MNHYVYEITNLVNGKKYIGKRSCHCDIEKDKYMGSGKLLKLAIKKYGIENFKKEILHICENEQMAYEWERIYIEQVKAYDDSNYYNIHFGGSGFSSSNVIALWKNDNYRSKITETRRKMWQDEEYRRKEIARRKELGKTKEFKEKVSIASKKNWENTEYRQKQIARLNAMSKDKEIQYKKGQSLKGRKYSKETIEKIRISQLGKHLGAKSALSQPIICLNTQEVFESSRLAGKSYNCDNSGISKSCRNVLKYSCGKLDHRPLFWMKLEEFNNLNDEEKKDKIEESKNYKYKMTLEQRKSISNHMKKRCGAKHNMATKIICLNTLEKFDYIKEATKKYGISNVGIGNCCKRKQKTAGKINGEPAKWMYYEDYLKVNGE